MTENKLFEFWKKKGWMSFLADAAFFFLFGYLILIVRGKVKEYITSLMLYADQIQKLSSLAMEQGTAALEQVQALVSSLGPKTTLVQVFVYVVLPVGSYFIWCFTQVVHYNLLHRKKVYNPKFVGRFFLVNLPYFLILVLFIELMFKQIILSETGTFNLWLAAVFAVLVAVLTYIMQVIYVMIYKASLWEGVKKAFKLAFVKFHVLFPLSLVSFLIFLIGFIFLWNIAIIVATGIGSAWLSVALLAVVLVVWNFYRVFFVMFIKKRY